MFMAKETRKRMTTISIPQELKDELDALGTVKDTYGTLIKELVDFYKEKK